ncbi:MAG: DNA-binding response regulator [Flavobacterium sp. BFFFF2]|nr:MAG: DNA-binding response regulator [Flavobacterium sp. BFFFF2]
MTKVPAILIEDDVHLREGFKMLLERYAPDMQVVAEADSVATGLAVLQQYQPQVVFLDIHLTDGTGFDLLENYQQQFGALTSQVIFITAHEQYALKAFRFSALDYLLKPIDPDELQAVLIKLRQLVIQQHSFAHIDLLLENMRKRNDSFKRIALTNSDGMHLFEVADIMRCESEDNYTVFYIKGHKPVLISKTLKEYDDLLSEHGFERVHQSHLVNGAYVKSYIKKEGGYLVMTDGAHIPVSQRKKERIQDWLNRGY